MREEIDKIKIKDMTETKKNVVYIIFIFLAMSTVVNGYGGSSGGGRSMTTTNIDPFSNIVKYEVRDGNLIYNKSIDYTFTSPEFGIYEIAVNGKENEFDVSVRIENLKNTSRYAKQAPGIVYKNENTWIGSKRLNYISVRFRVKNSWLEENELDDVRHPYLLKWNGTTWLVLRTNFTKKDNEYTYFDVPRAGRAYIHLFAISAPPKIKKNNNSDNWEKKIEEEIPDKEEIEYIVPNKSPGFEAIYVFIIGILMIRYIKKS